MTGGRSDAFARNSGIVPLLLMNSPPAETPLGTAGGLIYYIG